ncbi:hypothetical protein HPP92_022729 [Vanilla planifolia]|uniref:Uncharacterized protein n=1 Tax=Vanilla planifolia TaxID=51239 RepID=A0A835PW80_VANPL|nr:hypothetical protein HPP92_022729 [Vanilla planifolia]
MESPMPPVVVIPISEKKLESFPQDGSNPGTTSKDKEPAAAESSDKGLPAREGQKRRRTSQEEDEEYTSLHSQLIEMLDRNNRVLTAQLQVQNSNSQLDREQRKNQGEGLLCVLNKLADALGRIADKL